MLGSYAAILRRRLFLMIIIMLPVTELGFLYLTTRPAVYESEAVLEVGTGTISEDVLDISRPFEEPVRRVASVSEAVTSQPVVELAVAQLQEAGMDVDEDGALSSVTSSPRRSSNYFVVRSEADVPSDARALTDAFVSAFFEHRRREQQVELEVLEQGLVDRQQQAEEQLAEIQAREDGAGIGSSEEAAALASVASSSQLLESVRIRQLVEPTGISLLSGASTPVDASNQPSTAVALAASLLGGALIAVGITLVFELLADPIRTRQEAERLTALPVLGEMARLDRRAGPPAPEALASRGRAARLGLLARAGGVLPPAVLVAGAGDDFDDVFLVARALAESCVQSGQRVALIADPPEGGLLHVGGEGLRVEISSADSGLRLVLEQLQDSQVLWCRATSERGRQGLLDLSVPQRGVDLLRSEFDVVISAAGSRGVRAVDVGYLSERTIVVCSLGRTNGRRFTEFVGRLERELGPVRGIVLTTRPVRDRAGRGVGRRRRRSERAAGAPGAARGGRPSVPSPTGVIGAGAAPVSTTPPPYEDVPQEDGAEVGPTRVGGQAS